MMKLLLLASSFLLGLPALAGSPTSWMERAACSAGTLSVTADRRGPYFIHRSNRGTMTVSNNGQTFSFAAYYRFPGPEGDSAPNEYVWEFANGSGGSLRVNRNGTAEYLEIVGTQAVKLTCTVEMNR